MKLIITEKPSVAKTIAVILGCKKDGLCFKNEEYIITWAIGHLVTLADTNAYDESYSKWSLQDLPIIPTQWKYVPIKDKEEQLKIVCELLNKADVSEVINACDSGREGELIFRLIYEYSKSTKPVKRLWISSMEDSAILDGLENLTDNGLYNNLYQSANCRQRADWLVGINATRLFSILYGQTLNVGRVMSPTLAMIVERNYNIEKFKYTPFYTVVLEKNGIEFKTERILEEEKATQTLNDCLSNSLVVEDVQRKERVKNPPNLYDLTSLQRVCNRELGFSAKQTLNYVQSLYEKKLCTYPRTDSRFLTEDMESTLTELIDYAYNLLEVDISSKQFNPNKVMDNTKVSDHHALIPTSKIKTLNMQHLLSGEREVLKILTEQFICALSDKCEFVETVITLKCGEHSFVAKSESIVNLGFKTFLENENKDNDIIDFSVMKIGDTVEEITPTIVEGQTSPPKHHTEDTLLYAMEKASNDETDVDRDFIGIGTPSTRASIIDKLINIGLVKRVETKGNKSSYLLPTDKGISLVTVLPDAIRSSLTTAYWEEKLDNVENGNMTADAFMLEINQMIVDLVKNYETVAESEQAFASQYNVIGQCPRCKKSVVEKDKFYTCISGQCGFKLWKQNKFFSNKKKEFTLEVAIALLENGCVFMENCYSQTTGKSYNATFILRDDGNQVSYDIVFENKGK